MVVDEETELTTKDDTQKINPGESVFFPANMGEYTLAGKATILLITNQPEYYVEIDLGGTNKTNAPRAY